MKSTWKTKSGEAGAFTLTAGKWYDDSSKDRGIQTGPDARFYAVHAEIPGAPHSNEGKPLVLQVRAGHMAGDLRCRGERWGRPSSRHLQGDHEPGGGAVTFVERSPAGLCSPQGLSQIFKTHPSPPLAAPRRAFGPGCVIRMARVTLSSGHVVLAGDFSPTIGQWLPVPSALHTPLRVDGSRSRVSHRRRSAPLLCAEWGEGGLALGALREDPRWG